MNEISDFRIRKSDDFPGSESNPNVTLYCCCTCCIFLITGAIGAAVGFGHGYSWWNKAPFWGAIGAFLSSVAFAIFWGAIGVVVGAALMGARI